MTSKYGFQTKYDLNKELNKATNPTEEDIVLYFNRLVNPRPYDDAGETFIWSCALLYFNNCVISEPNPITQEYHVEITNEHLEEKYNSLDEATQLTITSATGYKNEHNSIQY
ncbi:hypothetical protein [Shewanella sp.]|uniref:hypothetical protein n=1 Tax=Shewanella sp. TaxID=50422 RepID=UPI0040488BA7